MAKKMTKKLTGIDMKITGKNNIKLSPTGEKFRNYNMRLVELINEVIQESPSDGFELLDNSMALLLALESAKLAVVGAMQASKLISKKQVKEINSLLNNYSKTRASKIKVIVNKGKAGEEPTFTPAPNPDGSMYI